MKIHSVKYYDKLQEWKYDSIHFSDLTLLVGVSGVGKTQILDSLINLKRIVEGMPRKGSGVTWEISFSNEDAKYFWAGEFESLDSPLFLRGDFRNNNAKLIRETIQVNGKEIAIRKQGRVFFQGRKMPKLAQNQSLINIFKEEDDIKKAYEGFSKIMTSQSVIKSPILDTLYGDNNSNKLKKKYITLTQIRDSDLSIGAKLYCLHENQKDEFSKIKEQFIDIFQQVEDVKIEDFATNQNQIQTLVLFIKEKGVSQWIPQFRISSGMLRTFIHISQLHLLKKGTVILIDEFENSLGINCINVLAEDLMFENNDIQFIITSHHPYIINQIPYEYWKIVTRENGKIVTYDAEEFNLGESHHERFMNLINLPTYKKGIVHA